VKKPTHTQNKLLLYPHFSVTRQRRRHFAFPFFFFHCAKVFLFCSQAFRGFSFSSTFATCQRLILAAKVIYILACTHFPIEVPNPRLQLQILDTTDMQQKIHDVN